MFQSFTLLENILTNVDIRQSYTYHTHMTSLEFYTTSPSGPQLKRPGADICQDIKIWTIFSNLAAHLASIQRSHFTVSPSQRNFWSFLSGLQRHHRFGSQWTAACLGLDRGVLALISEYVELILTPHDCDPMYNVSQPPSLHSPSWYHIPTHNKQTSDQNMCGFIQISN